MDIQRITTAEFTTGNGSVGTTPLQLPDRPIYKGVTIKAHADNSGVIYVGHSPAAGFALNPGETLPLLPIDNAAMVFVWGSTSGQLFSWVAA